MSTGPTRRSVVTAGIATAGAIALAQGTAGAAFAGTPKPNPTHAPDACYGQWAGADSAKARFRYWWPGADITPDEVAKEVNAIADAGFGGFEIADVRNSEHEAMPASRYGWGSPAWKAGVVSALQTAQKRNLSADLTIGPYWPAVVPGIKPDDEAAMKELTYGQAILAGGAQFAAAVPAPHKAPSGVANGFPPVTVTPKLEAVHAARVVGSTTATPLVLEQASFVDISSKVSGGTLTWTAPAGGNWAIVASYSRGTGMIERQPYYEGFYYGFTDPQAYVVDHFGATGSKAIVNWWETSLLTPQIRSLLHAVGGNFFEDSLEFLTELHWTPKMLSEFQARRGYSLTPYLPLVQGQNAAVYVLDDATIGPRVRWDYFQTLADLYIDNHVTVLNNWAKTLGMSLRNQAYGAPLDSALSAASTGIPEGESLAFGSSPDSFRMLAAGRDIGGRTPVLSSEMGAAQLGAYKLTIASLVKTANPGYAVGVNQVRIHGFPYASSPSGQWPGFFPWAPLGAPFNFGEAWGPRQPQWQFISHMSGYMERTHQVLQSGTNKVDVAIYREQFDSTKTQFDGAALTTAGYSYQPFNWGLLGLPAAAVQGKVLDRQGPGYKALVINNQATMLLESAKKILDFARRGLPVVIIGALPATTTGYAKAAASDAALVQTVNALVAQPSVSRVATAADVPGALQQAGLLGSSALSGITGLLHVRRDSGNVSYHYLYNSTAATVSGTVTLEGSGIPYLVDQWTGKITPIAVYDGRSNGVVKIPVQAVAGEAIIISLTSGRGYGIPATPRYAVSSNTVIVKTKSGLNARATAPGTYTAVLDNGKSATARVASVPAAPVIGSWALSVEDWQPEHPGGVETDAIGTVKTLHSFTLSALSSWQGIAGLEDVSGVGTYTATVTLPADWASATGATLNLGNIGQGSAHVTVNGQDVGPINQVDPVIDLGSALRAGSNVIVVKVATTLLNRLRTTRPTVYTQPRQDYGLIGPVTITPYVDAELA